MEDIVFILGIIFAAVVLLWCASKLFDSWTMNRAMKQWEKENSSIQKIYRELEVKYADEIVVIN